MAIHGYTGVVLLACCIVLLVRAGEVPECGLSESTESQNDACDSASFIATRPDIAVNMAHVDEQTADIHDKELDPLTDAHCVKTNKNTCSAIVDDDGVRESASREDSDSEDYSIGNTLLKFWMDVKSFIGQQIYSTVSDTSAHRQTDTNSDLSDGEKIELDEFLQNTKKMAAALLKDLGNEAEVELIKDIFTPDNSDDESEVPEGEDVYEYPPLTSVDPGTVGEHKTINIVDGMKHTLITRSVNPPIYEIPNFLTHEECDHIIDKAEKKGMKVSKIFKDRTTTLANQSVESRVRNSESSFLDEKKGDIEEEFMETIYRRVARLTQLPVEVIRYSEMLAIGRYVPGGFYNAHLDSTMIQKDKPCCFQTECRDDEGNITLSNWDCCRFCRYATVLYYLSDVDEGGETAFPLADTRLSEMLAKGETTEWGNLTSNCYEAPVVIKPEKGKALFWYNHSTDRKGYLGALNKRSYHGGCNVKQGTKWIATNWITTPSYTDRFKKSKFSDDYNSFDVY